MEVAARVRVTRCGNLRIYKEGIAMDIAIASASESIYYAVKAAVGEPLICRVRREPPAVMFLEIEFIRVSAPFYGRSCWRKS